MCCISGEPYFHFGVSAAKSKRTQCIPSYIGELSPSLKHHAILWRSGDQLLKSHQLVCQNFLFAVKYWSSLTFEHNLMNIRSLISVPDRIAFAVCATCLVWTAVDSNWWNRTHSEFHTSAEESTLHFFRVIFGWLTWFWNDQRSLSCYQLTYEDWELVLETWCGHQTVSHWTLGHQSNRTPPINATRFSCTERWHIRQS